MQDSQPESSEIFCCTVRSAVLTAKRWQQSGIQRMHLSLCISSNNPLLTGYNFALGRYIESIRLHGYRYLASYLIQVWLRTVFWKGASQQLASSWTHSFLVASTRWCVLCSRPAGILVCKYQLPLVSGSHYR